MLNTCISKSPPPPPPPKKKPHISMKFYHVSDTSDGNHSYQNCSYSKQEQKLQT